MDYFHFDLASESYLFERVAVKLVRAKPSGTNDVFRYNASLLLFERRNLAI